MKEIGLSFLIHVKTDSGTARAVATKQGASRKNKHIYTRHLFIQDLVFRKLLTTSAIKTDVNPSDIGTNALGREPLCLDWVLILLKHVHLEIGTLRVTSRTYAEFL